MDKISKFFKKSKSKSEPLSEPESESKSPPMTETLKSKPRTNSVPKSEPKSETTTIQQEINVPSSSESIDPHSSTITFAYRWSISNFSLLYDEDHPWKWRICSNEFSPTNNEELQFELLLYPKGRTETCKNYVSTGVNVFDMPKKYANKIRCQWNVSIVDENGEMCWTKETKNFYHLLYKQWQLIELIEPDQLLNCASQHLPNDQLTLHFEIHLQADEPIFNVIANNELDRSRFDCANKVTKVVHTWTIENFDDLLDASTSGQDEVAPYFIQSSLPTLDQQSERFCVRLCPNGWNNESQLSVDIFIWNLNEERANVYVKTTIFGMDGDRPDDYTREDIWKIPAKYGRNFGLHRNYFESHGLVQDKKLKINFEMYYMMDSTYKLNHTQVPDSVPKPDFDFTQKVFFFVAESFEHKFRTLYLNSSENHSIDEKIFELPIDPRIRFHLCLWPNGHDEQNKNYLSLDLCNVSQDHVTVQYRISILRTSRGKKERWVRWGDQSDIKRDGKVSRSRFFLRPQNPSLISHYLPDDKLTIHCELWVVRDRKGFKPKPAKPIAQSSFNNFSGQVNGEKFHNAFINLGGIVNIENATTTSTSYQ